jgi:hypothetical protein
LSLPAAARLFPGHRGGAAVNPSTVFRWVTKGVRVAGGQLVRLEAVRVGCRWLTSRGAVSRFVAHLTATTPAGAPAANGSRSRPTATGPRNAPAPNSPGWGSNSRSWGPAARVTCLFLHDGRARAGFVRIEFNCGGWQYTLTGNSATGGHTWAASTASKLSAWPRSPSPGWTCSANREVHPTGPLLELLAEFGTQRREIIAGLEAAKAARGRAGTLPS